MLGSNCFQCFQCFQVAHAFFIQFSLEASAHRLNSMPYNENPKLFLRLLAASKTPRIIFYVIAFGIVSTIWYPNGVLLAILSLRITLVFGPWNLPRKCTVDGWFIWAGQQRLWKPWRAAPQPYSRFADGTFRLRGDRWALQRLQKLFDGERFKELRRQLRRNNTPWECRS